MIKEQVACEKMALCDQFAAMGLAPALGAFRRLLKPATAERSLGEYSATISLSAKAWGQSITDFDQHLQLELGHR